MVGQADSLTFYRFQTTVIVIGGFQQNPDPTQQNQQGNGLFNLGRRLYAEDGYDVHLFGEHEQVREGPNIGTGAAYNWALRAVNQHNITNVVVMGFSWGGGATYNLLDRINRDLNGQLPPFQNHFVVPFTAYVDAIVHGDARNRAPEIRLAPLTLFHVNYYQQRTRFPIPINGAPVPGSNVNRDVNNPQISNQVLFHTTIDDDPNVQDEIVRHFGQQVRIR